MNDKLIINQRQYTWLIASVLTGGGLLSLQSTLIRTARIDAWSSFWIPTLYALGIAALLYSLARRFPGKHLFEIVRIVLGRWGGTAANLIMLLHIWMILVRNLRTLGKFITTTLLPHTPEPIVIMLFILVLIYFGQSSYENIGRVNDIVFPIFFGLFLFMPVIVGNEISFNLMHPILTTPLVSIGSANTLGIGWFADLFIAGAFLHSFSQAKQLHASVRHGVLIAAFLLTYSIGIELAVFGPVLPGNFLYPSYTLIQQVHITDFLDRLDLFILAIWYPIITCKVVLIYYAYLIGIVSLIGQRNYSAVNKPAGLFLIMTSILGLSTVTELINFGVYGSVAAALLYQPVLFVIVYIAARLRTSGQPGAKEPPDEPEKQQSAARRTRLERWAVRYSFRSWRIATNIMLLLGGLFILAGNLYGKQFVWLGSAGGYLYGFCLFASLLTSHMETLRTRYG